MNTAIFPHTYRYRDVNDTSLGETSIDGKFCSSISDIYHFPIIADFSIPSWVLHFWHWKLLHCCLYIIWIMGVSPRLSTDVYFYTVDFVGGLPLMCLKCYMTLFVLFFHNRPWRRSSSLSRSVSNGGGCSKICAGESIWSTCHY